MFVKRDIARIITDGAKQSPIISVNGPRQSGKSTLLKKIFSDYTYVDMQDADTYEFANTDPKGFLNTYKNATGLIIDEAQYAPRLFSQLKVEVDKNPEPGRYILSGSQSFLLHEKISESLAGRVYMYTLLPLSISELKQADILSQKTEDQIYKGFYPRIYQPHIDIELYYKNYISTYVERDIRTLKNIDNILVFKKFMQLCALRIGSLLNITDLATSCGVSVITAKNWLSLLETSFVLFLLPSYHNNLNKRLIKSPKLYFYDVGLAANLMNIDRETIIQNRTIYGALFENMVLVDIIKHLHNHGIRRSLTFFRDTNQHEIDLIIERGQEIIPLEIKASETINPHFFDTINWFKKEIMDTKKSIIVYGGNQTQKRSAGDVISWKNAAESIQD